MTWLAIALGGALGAVGRAAVGVFMPYLGLPMPWVATLTVNTTGGLLAGCVFYWLQSRPEATGIGSSLILIGFLGGFTTYSAFTLQIVSALRDERWQFAFSYLSLSIVLPIAAAWLAILTLQWLWQT